MCNNMQSLCLVFGENEFISNLYNCSMTTTFTQQASKLLLWETSESKERGKEKKRSVIKALSSSSLFCSLFLLLLRPLSLPSLVV